MFRRLAPYLVVFAGLGFFACVGYFAYLARTSPQYANALTGQVTRMNDHGYAFYVLPWQGWVLNMGPIACVGAMLGIAGISRGLHGDFRTATGPRWLLWVYLAGLGACLFYVFHRFP